MTVRQEKLLKAQQEKKIKDRFFSRNIEAVRWCNNYGLTIYASAQAFNTMMVKIFVQKGVPFKPLNDILYNQNKKEDVIAYTAAIDAEYERLYIKLNNK